MRRWTRAAATLMVVILAIGLASTPVECAIAHGPHSLYQRMGTVTLIIATPGINHHHHHLTAEANHAGTVEAAAQVAPQTVSSIFGTIAAVLASPPGQSPRTEPAFIAPSANALSSQGTAPTGASPG